MYHILSLHISFYRKHLQCFLRILCPSAFLSEQNTRPEMLWGFPVWSPPVFCKSVRQIHFPPKCLLFNNKKEYCTRIGYFLYMRLHLGRLLLKNDALGRVLGGTKRTPRVDKMQVQF